MTETSRTRTAVAISLGYVYFLQNEEGTIKIGWTQNLCERLDQLQTGNHQTLRYIAWVPSEAPAELESQYHKRFEASRIRGEWFRPSDEILAEVDMLRAGGNVFAAHVPEVSTPREILQVVRGYPKNKGHRIYDDRDLYNRSCHARNPGPTPFHVLIADIGWIAMKSEELLSCEKFYQVIFSETGKQLMRTNFPKPKWAVIIASVTTTDAS